MPSVRTRESNLKGLLEKAEHAERRGKHMKAARLYGKLYIEAKELGHETLASSAAMRSSLMYESAEPKTAVLMALYDGVYSASSMSMSGFADPLFHNEKYLYVKAKAENLEKAVDFANRAGATERAAQLGAAVHELKVDALIIELSYTMRAA